MKKRTSGLLIRLIDVVLILLFGFISISQMEKKSRIHLPVSSETPLVNPDPENLIRVSIYPYGEKQWGYLIENEIRMLTDIQQLHAYLKMKKSFFTQDVRVKIYSEATAPIKYAMQVADLCVQLSLKKSLIVRRINQRPGI